MKLKFRYVHSNPAASKLSEHIPVIFHHIPRTGGTTLRTILVAAALLTGRQARPFTGTVYGQYLGEGKQESLDSIKTQDLSGAPIMYGHIPWNSQGKLPHDCAAMTLMRNPIDRVVSHYKFGVGRKGWPLGTSIASLVGRGLIVSDTATRMLAGLTSPADTVDEAIFELALANLKKADLVGDLTSFDRFCGHLLGALQLPDFVCIDANPTANVLEAQTKRAIREEAEDICGFDKRLYQHVRGRVLVKGKKPRPSKREDSRDYIYLQFPKRGGEGSEVMKVAKSKVSAIPEFLRDQFPGEEIEVSLPKAKKD